MIRKSSFSQLACLYYFYIILLCYILYYCMYASYIPVAYLLSPCTSPNYCIKHKLELMLLKLELKLEVILKCSPSSLHFASWERWCDACSQEASGPLLFAAMGMLRFVIAGFDVPFLAGWHLWAKLCWALWLQPRRWLPPHHRPLPLPPWMVRYELRASVWKK